MNTKILAMSLIMLTPLTTVGDQLDFTEMDMDGNIAITNGEINRRGYGVEYQFNTFDSRGNYRIQQGTVNNNGSWQGYSYGPRGNYSITQGTYRRNPPTLFGR